MKRRSGDRITSRCSRSHDSSRRKITIGKPLTRNGRRVCDKKLFCFICNSKVLWLSRHFEKCHSDDFLVTQVLMKKGVERRNGLKRLKNLVPFSIMLTYSNRVTENS